MSNPEFITPMRVRCEILAEVLEDYNEDTVFADFCDGHFDALELATAVCRGEQALEFEQVAEIEWAWDRILDHLGLEDKGFESLSEMLDDSDRV